jgi:hypothetical protein
VKERDLVAKCASYSERKVARIKVRDSSYRIKTDVLYGYPAWLCGLSLS